jgi:UPF0042 nucleotide-binding protein
MNEAPPELDESNGPHVVLLSGLSGGGKTAAAKLFEDLAYTVVDNLPSELLPGLAELVLGDPARFARVAIVLDVRAGDAETAYRAMRGALEGRGIRPQGFFLEASTEAAIALERRLLDPIRSEADVVLDTTDLPLRELRERLFASIAELQPDTMTIQLISFGFKFGIPLEADMVFDTRFIQNPYYVPELRELSGLTEPVRSFVLAQPGAGEYLDLIDRMLEFTIPAFADEGKSRRTVGIGRTGGRLRTLVFAEEHARRLREEGHGPIEVFHRELERT